MRLTLRRGVIIVLLAGAALVVGLYLHDIGQAYERIAGKSEVVELPQGRIEFAQGGSGLSVLVVHGSGGGFDQGELIAQTVLGERFAWIAPSRFGYLRSTVPTGATFDHQAQAFAELLDHLRIQKVAVVALSHGGPSALLFALLYPDRVSSLTLISCGVAWSPSPEQAGANRQGNLLTMVYRLDALYWGISTMLRQPLLSLMGADAELVATLSEDKRALVDRIIDEMNPVAPRAEGVAFDNLAALPNQRIAAIRAPTLILHARDDTLQRFANAEYAAATIPGAVLRSFDRGGHFLLAVEQDQIQSTVQRFIRTHSAP